MLKFDEEKQLASVQGALALRPRIEAIVDGICKDDAIFATNTSSLSITCAGWASAGPMPPASRPRPT